MQHEFREGDWVRHHSFSEPIRVIGIGSTIAVQFPNGEMRAFEPEELERVSIAPVRRPKRRQVRGRGSTKRSHLSGHVRRFDLFDNTSACRTCGGTAVKLPTATPSIRRVVDILQSRYGFRNRNRVLRCSPGFAGRASQLSGIPGASFQFGGMSRHTRISGIEDVLEWPAPAPGVSAYRALTPGKSTTRNSLGHDRR